MHVLMEIVGRLLLMALVYSPAIAAAIFFPEEFRTFCLLISR
jgi:ABC-type Mn2+/Zn2+ transport system permease subunit